MMNDKLKTCCFTGHRKIPPADLLEISRRLETILIQLIEQGYVYFIAGGALGFDTLAAQTVLKLKTAYPHIALVLALPCENQAARWKHEDQIVYADIKAKADQVVYTSKAYIRGCMHRRNRYLVESSNCRICYLTQETGGTAYTVHYARENGLTVYSVATA